MIKASISVWACSMFAMLGMGQDTVLLRSFTVTDSFQVASLGTEIIQIDSLQKMQPMQLTNMKDVLVSRTGMTFKDYGPGLLATPTYRGGDASHTQVLWNGMRLNSPALGSVDFSALPSSQFQALTIYNGNASSMFSSGGLGSVINLEQTTDYTQKELSVGAGLASFENHFATIRFNTPFKVLRKHAGLAFSADVQQAQNRFPYLSTGLQSSDADVIMEGASCQRINLSFSGGAYVSERTQIEWITWLNQVKRHVPPTSNLSHPSAFQFDQSLRSMITIRHIYSKHALALKSMVESVQNDYQDLRLDVDNHNDYISMQHYLEWLGKVGKSISGQVRLGMQGTRAVSENYTGAAQMLTSYGNAKLKWEVIHHRISADFAVRVEQFQQNLFTLPAFGVRIRPIASKAFVMLGSMGKSVRFPTLNERFWQPGGNAALKPEIARTQELSLQWPWRMGMAQVSLYHIQSEDRIRWLPDGAIFTPSNLEYTVTNGIDLHWEGHYRVRRGSIQPNFNYHFIRAQGSDDGSDWFPITYVPNHAATGQLDYKLHSRIWSVQYRCQSAQWITRDETWYMPGFGLLALGFGRNHDLGRSCAVYFSVWVENVLNNHYQIMPWRPMPGRSFTFKLNVQWRD